MKQLLSSILEAMLLFLLDLESSASAQRLGRCDICGQSRSLPPGSKTGGGGPKANVPSDLRRRARWPLV